MFGINFNRGTMVIVDFVKDGEEHQSVRWSTDPQASPGSMVEYQKAIEMFYQSIGAEITMIRKVEVTEHCITPQN